MRSSKVFVVFLASSLAFSAPHTALADGSAFVGGLVGGIVGSAIGNAQQKQRTQKRVYVRPSTTVNSYQRQQNRETQTALNYFGFNAGVADGVMGRNSRAAVGRYQAFLGYPATGVLTEYERTFLQSSYQRAAIGGPQNAQIMQAQGQGVRGLLLGYRQEQYGGSTVAAAPTSPEPAPQAAAAAPQVVEAATETQTTAGEVLTASVGVEGGALPSFMPLPQSESMASHCNRVSLTATSSGGYVTIANMDDPMRALDEQFCIGRTYAIDQGDGLASSVQGFTAAEIREQCEAFAPSMRKYLAGAGSETTDELRGSLRDFVASTGASPAQVSGNARICLGVGYSTDNAELAVGALMVLIGLGDEAYGELLGYHLRNGFGVAERADRGLDWISEATDALAGGASPLVVAGGDQRVQLVRDAVSKLSGALVLQDASAGQFEGGLFVLPTVDAAAE